ncbi:unnamed protein product [Rotaria sordida]|uniref:F-box domain-containing protein n=1 Tax=Rotaria sordida TaxID=392033 RepID=A0A815RYY1_9BILA|nr:unnamed protein product [Rotaria sordida]CAF4161804.1 unnamed protein product [Rotaria sordida]
MKYSSIELNDLPVEILIYIFKKISNVEVLYSLINTNQLLNQIVRDPIFTSDLFLLNCFSDGSISSLSNRMLDKFCLQILPDIGDKIKWLNLESSSMERILLSTNYSNVCKLGLYGLEIEKAKYLFTEKTYLIDIFKNQISSLIINITESENQKSIKNMIKLVFIHILTIFTKLEYLIFDVTIAFDRLSFFMSPPTIISSTLLELRVSVSAFSDCLYLLDGRFNQLRALYVEIHSIHSSRLTINNKENLPKLKCFSLHCDYCNVTYDELIIPLLHRMLNLETLDLYLRIEGKLIDGDQLKTNIINYMLRLNKFIFFIFSTINLNNQIHLPSNEDIQHTFREFHDNRIISYVHYLPKTRIGQCHIYTYPYQLKYYHDITNSFPGGLFKYVREISLYDEYPFEHEFFIRIQQSFPFMKKLSLNNAKPQKNIFFNQSKNDYQNLSIIKYSHLIQLDLHQAHKDYLEEFLLDIKTCLPNNVQIFIPYRPLKNITYNFTRDATRMNCSKVIYPYSHYLTRLPKHFKDYFLHTYE